MLRPPHVAPLATLSLGIALYSSNVFLVATALPGAVLDIGGVALLAWASTLFLVAAIVAGAAGAAVKGWIGARGALLLGGAVFLAGTIAAGAAHAMPMLLAGRAMQGAGEGLVAAVSYALIPVLFPPRLVTKVFAVEAIVWAAAGFAGPAVGGLLTETVSWRAAFLASAPLAVLFLVLVVVVLPPAAGTAPSAQPPLLRLSGIAAGILLVAASSLAGTPWLAGLAVAAGGTVLALVVTADRRRATDRLFPRDAFAPTSILGAGLWLVLLMPVAHSAIAVYLTLALQQGWGFGPTLAGALFAVGPLSWSGSMLIVASLRHRRVPEWGLVGGPPLLALGLAGVLAATLADAPWAMLPFLVIVGASFGVGWAFLSVAVMRAAPPAERDHAAGLVPTVQSAGFAIGAALCGLAASVVGLDGSSREGTLRGFAWVVGLGLLPAALAILAGLRLRAAA